MLCFQTLVPMQSQYVSVPDLNVNEAQSIITLLLQNRARSLTSTQMEIILTTFKNSPSPLFLKVRHYST